MKINILGKTAEYENTMNNYDKLISDIDDQVNRSNKIFSHLIIDGIEVYDDFYEYFLDNIKNIEEVTVVTKTIKEISQDILVSTIDYIEGAIPEIDMLSTEFYKRPSKNSWEKLADLIEGFKWIIDSFAIIDSNTQLKKIVNSYEEWNLYAKDIHSLNELLVDFEEILKNNDLVSIADILSYEIKPLFKSMKEKLEKVVLEEVDINNASRK